MSYTDSLLTPGERVVRRASQHPLLLVARSGWAILAFVVAGVLLFLRAAVSGANPILGALGYLTLALVVFGVVDVTWHVLRFISDEIVITSLRFVRASGVVNKRASDASLAQVSDAVLTEPFLGRILGFGDLHVVTASTIGVQRLAMVRDAKAFQLALIEARHELALQIARPTMPAIRVAAAGPTNLPVAAEVPSTPQPPLAPAEVVAELRRLADQRAAGDIDDAAFDARRRDLLGRI
ncbi:MAG TPA: PH domain-containing protein [Candidatus Limnocylindrales bacterium]|jgi:hypothetical protein